MASWRASVPSTTSAAAWLREFGLVVLFAAESRRARTLPSFWYQLSRKQFANGPLTNHSKWWGRVPEKARYAPPSVTFLGVGKFTSLPNSTPQLCLQRSLWSTSFNCKVKDGHPVSFNDHHNPVRLDFCAPSLNSYPECNWTRLQGSSWNPSNEIQRLCEVGELEKAVHLLLGLDRENQVPSAQVYRSLLKLSAKRKALAEAKQVHAHFAKHGLKSAKFLGESIVSTFVKCGGLKDALQVFETLPRRTAVSWTAMISGYTAAGRGEEALRMYGKMLEESSKPDRYTFVSLLKACGSMCDVQQGKRIHAEAVKYEVESDLLVATALIDMYSKCGRVVDAKNVFDALPERDVVLWTAMLTAYVQQGKAKEALDLYSQMQVEGICRDSWTYVGGVQACGMLAENEEGRRKVKYLQVGREIHAKAWDMGYKSDLFLGNALISMYGKCGSIEYAKEVFDALPQRDGVSWNAMLVAYSQQGLAEEALQLYDQMLEQRTALGARTFVVALHACGILADKDGDAVGAIGNRVRALEKGRAIHTDAWRSGYEADMFISNTLISMYGKCGSLVNAQKVFDLLHQRTLVSWNAIIAAHAHQGEVERVFQLYKEMAGEGMSADDRTLVSLLQACGVLAVKESVEGIPPSECMALNLGRKVHYIAKHKGYDTDIFVANSIISLYGKCGNLADAREVFDSLTQRNTVSWNAMLAVHIQEEQAEIVLELYEKMLEEDINPDDITFVSALQAVAMLAEKEKPSGEGQAFRPMSLVKGRAIHSYFRTRVGLSDSLTSSTLISMYGKCGSVSDAQNAFNGLFERNLASWNAMLAAYVQQGEAAEVLQLYEQLLEEGLCPDDRTIVCVLQACGLLAEKEGCDLLDERSSGVQHLEKGRKIHAGLAFTSYGSDLFVGSTLVSMYGKCGSIADSQIVFGGLPRKDVVVWNAMLMAYCQQEEAHLVMQTYEKMLGDGITPDDRTFVTVLQACGLLADEEGDVAVDCRPANVSTLVKSKALHAAAWSKGLGSDVFVVNMLITVYGKTGSNADAQLAFDRLSQPNVVSWTALLCAYVQLGQGEKALELYKRMQEEGVSPNEVTHICILQACSSTGRVDICRQIHRTLVSSGKDMSPLLGNTLIHTYGNCAAMLDAKKVFDDLIQRNVVSWNTLIAGYAREGDFAASLRCYEEMRLTGMKPNGVTFCSLLSACSHAGLVDKGVEYFQSMSSDYCITPEIWHYVSLVDLLGRAGLFARVEHLLSTLPVQPNLALWLCLLGACRKHGKLALARHAFNCAVKLEPQHAAAYVIMCNMYVNAGLWDSAMAVKEMGQNVCASKKPGQSWIDYEQEAHSFVVGDMKHEQLHQLYELLGHVALDLQEVYQQC